jgi:hypothetical protein
MADGIQITTLKQFRDSWRVCSKGCEHLQEASKNIDRIRRKRTGDPEMVQTMLRVWSKFRVRRMRIELLPWAVGVLENGLFTRYNREFEVFSPIARFATISHYVDGTFLCQSALRDTGFRATPLNLIHCAQRNWDSFSEQEKSRTIEVVTGCILAVIIASGTM